MVETFRCQTHGLTISDVKGKTLVDTLAETLAKVKAISLADKVSDVEAEALDYTLADTLTEVNCPNSWRECKRCVSQST